MFHRHPSSLVAATADAGLPLARLNSLDGFARSILVGIVPLLALQSLGSKEAVAQAYLVGSIITLSITLNFASLERILQRRWVVTLAGAFLIIAPAALFFGQGLLFSAGIGLRSAAASLFSICLSLYIMEYIGKNDLVRNESRRMVYSGAAWLIGPTVGVMLWTHGASWMPFALASLSGAGMLVFFWRLRLGSNPIVKRARRTTVNPLRLIPRYFKQPALRIAYLITLTRSSFWVSIFVFGPIYVVEAGLPTWVAGGLLSFVSGLLFMSPLVNRLSRRFGTRTMITAGLTITGLSVSVLCLVGGPAPVGIVFWIMASIGAVILDVLGNIPFMRMVKPWERTEMATIFSTWREGSELLTPLAASAVLLFAPFQVFYVVLGGFLLVAAFASTFLPKRL